MKQLLPDGVAYLPTTREEFDIFTKEILDTYSFPDKDEYRHAIATMIMHLDPQTITKDLDYFANSIKKAQANQVAYEIIQEINNKQKEASQLQARTQEDTPHESRPEVPSKEMVSNS